LTSGHYRGKSPAPSQAVEGRQSTRRSGDMGAAHDVGVGPAGSLGQWLQVPDRFARTVRWGIPNESAMTRYYADSWNTSGSSCRPRTRRFGQRSGHPNGHPGEPGAPLPVLVMVQDSVNGAQRSQPPGHRRRPGRTVRGAVSAPIWAVSKAMSGTLRDSRSGPRNAPPSRTSSAPSQELDVTFSAPKSVNVASALAERNTQAMICAAHQ